MPTQITAIAPEDDAFHLFEGPVWIDDTLYISDIATNPWSSTLRAYVPATGMVTNVLPAAGTNGMALAADGTLYSATSGKQEISRLTLSPPGQETVVPAPLNSPNDIAVADDGTIYFSDPQQDGLPVGNLPQVVHVVKDGQDEVFSEELQQPNGVTLSLGQDVLFVSGGGGAGYLAR
jgi:gluconolactonase